MPGKKTAELRSKSKEGLTEDLNALLREKMTLRMILGSGDLAQVHKIRENRRQIARVKTILSELSENKGSI